MPVQERTTLGQWIREARGELGKVAWSWRSAARNGFVVFVLVVACTASIALVDGALSRLNGVLFG
jgi:preprotein translocase subunit SecE